MKKLLFGLFAVVFAFNFASSQQRIPAPTKDVGQKIYITFGNKDRDCRGFNICEFRIELSGEEIIGILQALKTPDGKLKISMTPEFYRKNETQFIGNVFKIEEKDFVIERSTSKALGFSAPYIVRVGKYPIIYNASSRTYECVF